MLESQETKNNNELYLDKMTIHCILFSKLQFVVSTVSNHIVSLYRYDQMQGTKNNNEQTVSLLSKLQSVIFTVSNLIQVLCKFIHELDLFKLFPDVIFVMVSRHERRTLPFDRKDRRRIVTKGRGHSIISLPFAILTRPDKSPADV